MNNQIRSVSLASSADRENPVELLSQQDGAQKMSIPSLSVVTDAINASRDAFWFTVTPTIDNVLYTAGDCVGGQIRLPNVLAFIGECARLQQITVIDFDNEKAALELLIFERDMVVNEAATLTNNAPAVLGANGHLRVLARVAIAAADYVTSVVSPANRAFATRSGLNVELTSQYDCDLYCAFICTGGPTYTTAADLTFRFAFQRD